MTGQGPELFRDLGRPGKHEVELASLFDGRCRFEGSQPVLSTPLLLIAFTNRSGSSYFGELLSRSGSFGGGGEFLNAEVVAEMRRETGARSLPEHLEALARRSCEAGKVFAVKASWSQLAMIARWRLGEMFPGLRVIHVYRDDVVAQAVSFSIALQTGRWNARQAARAAPKAEPLYRERELVSILEAQAADNARIRAVTAAMRWPRMLVAYEALTVDPAHHVQQSQRFCGIDPLPFVSGPTDHKRQANALNNEFTDRLKEALAVHTLGHGTRANA
ncbi:MAG: Stf0 family sulfotransferase [Pseudomonadota bacterium]